MSMSAHGSLFRLIDTQVPCVFLTYEELTLNWTSCPVSIPFSTTANFSSYMRHKCLTYYLHMSEVKQSVVWTTKSQIYPRPNTAVYYRC